MSPAGTSVVDGADTLARGPELLVRVDLGGVDLVAVAQMVGAVLVRLHELHREADQLVAMLVPVLRVLVRHDTTGLAGVAPRDRGAVLVRTQQCVLVARGGARLGCGDEPGADPHTVGAQRQRCGQPAPVVQPAGRHYRNPFTDDVDDLRHQRHGCDLAGVSAGLGALRDHDVAPGLDRRNGMAHLAAHVHHQHVVLVTQLDGVAGHAEPGYEHATAVIDDLLHLGEHVAGCRGEQIDTERLAVSAFTASISSTMRSVPIVDAPRHPKPPASDTAATTWWYDTPPMPASITGCSTSRTSVNRVRMTRFYTIR